VSLEDGMTLRPCEGCGRKPLILFTTMIRDDDEELSAGAHELCATCSRARYTEPVVLREIDAYVEKVEEVFAKRVGVEVPK
jgi:hypothetical protein